MAKPYVSDITTMIRDLLKEKPQIVEEQKAGRAMWWDKTLDPDTQQRNRDSKVAQQAYVYQNKV
jgi:hypothetical protein